MNMSYIIGDNGRSITCLICDYKSWNPNDVYQKYCGRCKVFHLEHGTWHVLLHKMLEELVVDFIQHTNGRLSSTTIMELMQWSHKQTNLLISGDKHVNQTDEPLS